MRRTGAAREPIEIVHFACLCIVTLTIRRKVLAAIGSLAAGVATPLAAERLFRPPLGVR